MITMHVSTRSDGIDVATVGDITLTSRNGVECKMARELVRRHEDGPWQTVGPDDRVRFRGASLFLLALMTVSDTDSGVRFGEYQPRDFGGEEA